MCLSIRILSFKSVVVGNHSNDMHFGGFVSVVFKTAKKVRKWSTIGNDKAVEALFCTLWLGSSLSSCTQNSTLF